MLKGGRSGFGYAASLICLIRPEKIIGCEIRQPMAHLGSIFGHSEQAKLLVKFPAFCKRGPVSR